MERLVKTLQWQMNTQLTAWCGELNGITYYEIKSHRHTKGHTIYFWPRRYEIIGLDIEGLENCKIICQKHFGEYVNSLLW
jgi:hypothetical protein